MWPELQVQVVGAHSFGDALLHYRELRRQALFCAGVCPAWVILSLDLDFAKEYNVINRSV